MTYLLFTSKTKTSDGEFAGIIEAANFREAKTIAAKLKLVAPSLASAREIEFLKNDAKIRVSKTNTLPSNFDITKAKKLN